MDVRNAVLGAAALLAGNIVHSYIKDTYRKWNYETISTDQIKFLEAHKSEIEQMYEYKTPVGDWKELGAGASKIALTHPDFPGMLIKIPRRQTGYRGATGEDDLRIHHEALQQIQSIAAPFDRIVLPESKLYTTSKGLILVEQRFDLDYGHVPDSPDKQEAIRQIKSFIRAADLCDIYPGSNHNAGVISGLFPIKIGVFDFDCRNSQRNLPAGVWDWDFRNYGSQFFTKQNRNQLAALVLAAGMAILGGAAAVAKITSVANPRTVLQLSLGTGVAAVAVVTASLPNAHLPAAPMAFAGFGMAAMAITSISVMKAYSLARRLLI